MFVSSILPARVWRIALALVGALLLALPIGAQDSPAADPIATEVRSDEKSLQFSFEGAPWRDVIKWLAESADLALHMGDIPTGSFTYFDQTAFTPQEAIDRVNLFLLPEGFTLVRSGKLLSSINLTDRRSAKQLDSLARTVSIEELDQLDDWDVVKCVFPLGELDAIDAVEELTALSLMTTPAVFPKTNQIMITDVVEKLRSARTILGAFEPRFLANGTVVKSFDLEYADAEDILTVARPHLGLAVGEMIGIDVSLSADPQGKSIFVTGVQDKVQVIEGLVNAIDKPTQSLSTQNGEAELRSHSVVGGNVDTIYNVLQTLLAGRDVRLSADPTAGTIVALATPEVQTEIAQTVTQLQASEAEFAVIQLKNVDPYFAISLIEQMLDLADLERRSDASLEAARWRRRDDSEIPTDMDIPKIDADPGTMRLFVRAKPHQIEQIKQIVAGLDEGSTSSSGANGEIRIFPLRGQQVEQVLETAAKFWRAPNPIFFYRSNHESEQPATERVVAAEVSTRSTGPDTFVPPNARLLAGNPRSPGSAIRCQLIPRGLLLQSEDTDALDRFEEHLRAISGPVDSVPAPPTVFYLKYTKPEDAIRMLAELLDGGESAKEGEAGTLINGYTSRSSSFFLGSIVTSREGTLTMLAGSMTVVADSRLNRLIAQGTASDIELIESYLVIIDKDTSLTSIETYGTTHVIELVYTQADEVATAIRAAFAGRVASGEAGSSQSRQQSSGSRSERERESEDDNEDRDEDRESDERNAGKRKDAASQTANLEPTMTIAIHQPSNSLIVTAPDPLFREVQKLVQRIDSRSAETVEIVQMPEAVPAGVLQRILLGESAARRNGSSSSRSSNTSRDRGGAETRRGSSR